MASGYEKAGVDLELGGAKEFIDLSGKSDKAAADLFATLEKLGSVTSSGLEKFGETLKDIRKTGKQAASAASEAATRIMSSFSEIKLDLNITAVRGDLEQTTRLADQAATQISKEFKSAKLSLDTDEIKSTWPPVVQGASAAVGKIEGEFKSANLVLDTGKVESDLTGTVSDARTASSKVEDYFKSAKIDIKTDAIKGSFQEVKREASEASESMQESFGEIGDAVKDLAGEAFGPLGDVLGTIGGSGAVAAGGIGLAGAAIFSALDAAKEADKSFRLLQGQLGLTGEEAGKFAKIGQTIYSDNWGSSMEDINEALVAAKRNFSELNETDLKDITEAGIAIRDIFGTGLEETFNASSILVRNFGINGTEAMDLITKSFQLGGDKAGDLLDTIGEYSPYFKDMKFDAKEFGEILLTALKNGARNTDFAADAIKEFNIRIRDGSATTGEGFRMLGLDYDDFAKKLGSGAITGKQAMELVNGKLRDVKNSVDQNIAGVNLYGTQWEDLGGKVVLQLDKAGHALDDFKGATAAAGSQLTTESDKFGRNIDKIKQGFGATILPIANEILGNVNTAIESGPLKGPTDKTSKSIDSIGSSTRAAGEAAKKAEAEFKSFNDVIQAATELAKGNENAQEAAARKLERVGLSYQTAGSDASEYIKKEAEAAQSNEHHRQVLQNLNEEIDRGGLSFENLSPPMQTIYDKSANLSGQINTLEGAISGLSKANDVLSGKLSGANQVLGTMDLAVSQLTLKHDKATIAYGNQNLKLSDAFQRWKDLVTIQAAGGEGAAAAGVEAGKLKDQFIALDKNGMTPVLDTTFKAINATSDYKDEIVNNTLAIDKMKLPLDTLTVAQRKQDDAFEDGAMKARNHSQALNTTAKSADALAGSVTTASSDIQSGTNAASNNMSKLSTSVGTEVGKVKTQVGGLSFYAGASAAGQTIPDGMAAGINSMAWKVSAAAAAIASKAIGAARQTLSSASPSKEFIEIGKTVPEGFSIGIEGAAELVRGSMIDLVGNMNQVVEDNTQLFKWNINEYLSPVEGMVWNIDETNPVINLSLKEMLKSFSQTVTDQAGGFKDALAGFISPVAGLKNDITGKGKEIKGSLIDLTGTMGKIIEDGTPPIVEGFLPIPEAVADTGQGITDVANKPVDAMTAVLAAVAAAVDAQAAMIVQKLNDLLGQIQSILAQIASGVAAMNSITVPSPGRGSPEQHPGQGTPVAPGPGGSPGGGSGIFLPSPATAQQISNMYSSATSSHVVQNSPTNIYNMPLNVAPMQVGTIQQGYAHARAMIPV